MWQFWVGLVGLAALFLGACASREIAYRSQVAVYNRNGNAGVGYSRHSIERAVEEEFDDKDAEGKLEVYGPYDYLLGFVEYDDHGAPTLPGQQDALLREIEAEEVDLAIVVYVHGWKHSAADTDRDVQEFRWLLRGLSDVERGPAGRGRKVVGIYAGWRGSSFDPGAKSTRIIRTIIKPFEQLTFWTRKNAAHRVAKGSIRDLFAAVRDIQARRNDPTGAAAGPKSARRGDTRLILIGHSFGGLIVYDAVHQHLVESARAGLARGKDELVPAYGNMVVLLNPAFEGVAYASLHDLMEARESYAGGQPPVLVTFQSENDWATGRAFPLGRRFGTLFERTRDERQADENRRTIGHIERFWTHRLSLAKGAAPTPRRARAKPSAEPPPPRALSPRRQQARAVESQRALDGLDVQRNPDSKRLHRNWSLRFRENEVTLRHEHYAPNNPFWVVSTDSRILNGHNDIWNDDFLLTLNELYAHFCGPRSPSAPR